MHSWFCNEHDWEILTAQWLNCVFHIQICSMYFPTLILAKSTQLSIIMKHRHRQKLIYYLTNFNPKLTRSLFHSPYRLALQGVISSRSTNSAKIFTSHVFSVLAVQCCPFLEKKIARSSIRCTWRFFGLMENVDHPHLGFKRQEWFRVL